MNNKDYCKLVYKPVVRAGIYERKFGDRYIPLGKDFPALADCFTGFGKDFFKASKVEFTFMQNQKGVAWLDKHGNVVVRYMLLHKQTKIDFQNV